MDSIGDRFGLLVVDEVHHFDGGGRIEALESCTAIAPLGLTATRPSPGSDRAMLLADLVGPFAFEIGYADLVGSHLAPVTLIRLPVRLDGEEQAAYNAGVRVFQEMRRAYMRSYPGRDVASLLRAVGQTSAGRKALRDRGHALAMWRAGGAPVDKRAANMSLSSSFNRRRRCDTLDSCPQLYSGAFTVR